MRLVREFRIWHGSLLLVEASGRAGWFRTDCKVQGLEFRVQFAPLTSLKLTVSLSVIQTTARGAYTTNSLNPQS